MFKRVIKIILILLGVFLIILGIIWLVGRHSATKNGATPLSFRQFLGLGTKASPLSPAPGQNSSTFTNNGSNSSSSASGNGGGVGNGQGGNGLGNGSGSGGNGSGNLGNGSGVGNANGSGLGTTNVSQFTNGGTSLDTGGGLGGGNGAAGSIGTGSENGTDTSTTTTTDNGAGTTASDAATTPACSTADTTIDFTPEELATLNELQNRFYTIAQTLHTDADVETEVANHDAFAIKADQVTELYNYCEAQLPAAGAADPRMNLHIATPFWHAWNPSDPDQDSLSFLNFNGAGIDGAHLADIHDNNRDNPDTSGIKGPYGLLSFSSPNAVPINGSTVKTNSTSALPNPLGIPTPPNPLHIGGPGQTTTTNGSDYQLLIPVVEKILHINLW